MEFKPAASLTVADFQAYPVWEFINDDEVDETAVRPVTQLPVSDLGGKLVGTPVNLAIGREVWALLGNIDARNARLNQHFLTLSIAHAGRWFRLARYHDHDYAERGPEALARVLGLPVDAVFPINYDLRPYARGDAAALCGQVDREPKERLTRAEIIALAVR
jgi:hypothetical protein